jgi:hypothetical protein
MTGESATMAGVDPAILSAAQHLTLGPPLGKGESKPRVQECHVPTPIAATTATLIALTIGEHRTGSDYLRSIGAWAWWCRCNARGNAPDGTGADRAMEAHVAQMVEEALQAAGVVRRDNADCGCPVVQYPQHRRTCAVSI